MTRVPDTYHLAVDGGGTRCRIALSDGRKVQKIEVGAANVFTDFDAACAEIQAGLASLVGQAGISAHDLPGIPAYLGLAGITGQEIADRLSARLPFLRVRIADDRPSALRGALGAGDGVVAHCGTGSFLAAQIVGKTLFAGGWGAVLGDQASAQWVGRLALSKTLDSLDGMIPQSDLFRELCDRFKGGVGIVHAASNMSPGAFGAIAPLVTGRAENGDGSAQAILREGAEHLSDRIHHMGWQPGRTVCLTGGIGPFYGPYLPAQMQADLAQPLGDPMDGALALASEFREEILNERC